MNRNIYTLLLTLFILNLNLLAQHKASSRGDMFVVYYEGAADSVKFEMFSGLNFNLKKANDNYWMHSVNIKDLDKALFTYKLITFKDGVSTDITDKDDKLFVWRGEKRANTFIENDTLKGQYIETMMQSEIMEQERSISLYLPPNRQKDQSYPILYMGDGQILEYYAPYIDHLIESKQIQPIIVIGIHSNIGLSTVTMSMTGPDGQEIKQPMAGRTVEYLEGLGTTLSEGKDQSFEKHYQFFTEEVPVYIEKEYGIVHNKENKLLYGISNSAAFALTIAFNNPELYSKIIALSTVGYKTAEMDMSKDVYPQLYLAAGRYEDTAFQDNLDFVEKLKENNIDYKFEELICGHDNFVWQEELLERLVKIFNNK